MSVASDYATSLSPTSVHLRYPLYEKLMQHQQQQQQQKNQQVEQQNQFDSQKCHCIKNDSQLVMINNAAMTTTTAVPSASASASVPAETTTRREEQKISRKNLFNTRSHMCENDKNNKNKKNNNNNNSNNNKKNNNDADENINEKKNIFPVLESSPYNRKKIPKSVIMSLQLIRKCTKCNCKNDPQWFQVPKLSLSSTFSVSAIIRILILCFFWLSWHQKHQINLRKCKNLLLICLLFMLTTMKTSRALETAQPQTQRGINGLHTFRGNITAIAYVNAYKTERTEKDNFNYNDNGISTTTTTTTATATSTTTTPKIIIAAPSMPASSSSGLSFPVPSSVSDARIANLFSRDNILKTRHHPPTLTEAFKSNTAYISTSSCSTCHAREKARLDSLESIKMHILTQLRLPQYPEELSKPRQVPPNIIEKYYREYNHNGQRREFKKRASSNLQNASVKRIKPYNMAREEIDDSVAFEEDIVYEDNDEMQSDDPKAYSSEQYIDEENDEEFYSRINSIYIFPITTRLRHNRKSEFLTFKFSSHDQQSIMRSAILHLYIRGIDWMREYQPEVVEQISSNTTEAAEIEISIHKALRRTNSVNYTHTIQIAQTHLKTPSGLGKWIQIHLNDLPKLWMDQGIDSNLVVVVKSKENWMRQFIVTGKSDSKDEESVLTAHIEIRTEPKPGRQKRSTSLDCQESDNELRCCRYPLKVNFTSFGWSFVVAPTDFEAFFCNGECKLGFLEQHPHTHLAALTRSASPCCSPTKMSSLTLLYFNLESHLVLSTIPNMTVEKCSCS